MAKILSIEIGNDLTKVAELDYKAKKAKIHTAFVMQTPPNMVNTEGEVESSEVFETQLNAKLQEYKISTKNVIFVVNAARVVNRTITIPAMKENRVQDFVISNASDYFPYSLDSYQVSCDVEGQVEENGVKKLQVAVNCMPLSIVGSYENLASALGLTLVGLDHAGNAIKKMMLAEIPEDIKITFKMEENYTIITVIENGKVQFQRTANYGLDEVLDPIKNSNLFGDRISDLEALKLVDRKTVLLRRFGDSRLEDADGESDSELDQERLAELRVEVTNNMAPLVGNISKIMDVYDRDKTKQIEKIYLVGLGSICSGLSKLLSNELGIKVVSQQQFHAGAAEKAEDNSNCYAEYFTICGAALEPCSIIFSEKKDKDKGKGKTTSANSGMQKESYALPIIFAGVCLIIAVAMSAYALITVEMAKARNLELNTMVDKYAYAEELYYEYNAVYKDYQWVVTMDDVAGSPNDELVALIEELEVKMPSDIQVLTLTATDAGVTMNIYVGSKSEVADVISNLRTFSTLEVGTLSAITETVDDAGTKTVSFSIECAYRQPVVEEDAVNP